MRLDEETRHWYRSPMIAIAASLLLHVSTEPAQAVASPTASTPTASHCAQPVRVNRTLRSLRNVCEFPISLVYCAAPSDCGGGLTYLHLAPGFIPAAAFRDEVHWLACRAPAQPRDARYVPGRGVTGTCAESVARGQGRR